MPTTASLTNAPVTKSFLIYIVASALLATASDSKYLLPLEINPHVFPSGNNLASVYYGSGRQLWRCISWAAVYANSTEVLFAALTVWQLRVVERVWGSRKLCTFIVTTLPYTVLLPPALLMILRPFTAGYLNYLPPGPTSIIFAILAQYHAAIPYSFRYRVSASSASANAPSESATTPRTQGSPTADDEGDALTLTSKSMYYLPALQLALAQLPGSLIPAFVGWCVGYAWRAEILPMSSSMRAWRVPGWVVGDMSLPAPVAPSRRSRP